MGELDMSFSQWEKFTLGAATFSLDTITTIVGSSSLKLASVLAGQANTLPSSSSLLPCALTKGALRTLIKTVSLPNNVQVGLYCMANTRNATQGTSRTSYYVHFRNTGVSTGEVRLLKNSSGIGGASVVMATFPTMNQPTGSTFSLELQWTVAIDEINGVDLVVRYGSLTNFSDLTDVIHIIDTSSPLTITQGEGIGANDPTGISAWDVRYDQTTLLRIL